MNYILQYPKSACLYIFVIIFSFLLAYKADKKNNKYLLFFIIFILSIFSGFRSSIVGTDTLNYLIYFNRLSISNLFNLEMEFGFNILCYILLLLFKNGQIVLLVCSFLIVSFYLLRAWEIRDEYSFPIMVFLFVTGQYLISFNIMRQILAIMFAFWGTRYLLKKEYKKYIFVIAISSTIHISALLGLIMFFFFDLELNKRGSLLKKITKYCVVFALIMFFLKFVNIDKYISYFSNNNIVQEIKFSSSIMFVIIISFLEHCKGFKIKRFARIYKKEICSKYKIYSRVFLLGLVLSVSLSGYKNVSRIAYFFTAFEPMFYSFKYDSKTIKLIKIFVLIVSSVSSVLSMLATSGSGIMPYHFFWQ